jgi:hypothetical protein
MDSGRFERVARFLAQDFSRRNAVRRAGVGIGAAISGVGFPIGRALAQDATPKPQEGNEALQGQEAELPPDLQPLRDSCELSALGCRDFDADGICATSYLTPSCQVVEGELCPCPAPIPDEGGELESDQTGDQERRTESRCTPEQVTCYGDCFSSCEVQGRRTTGAPGGCARICTRKCGCKPVIPSTPCRPVDNSFNHNTCMAAAWTFHKVCQADCVPLSAACGPGAPGCLAVCLKGCDEAMKDYPCPPKEICVH